MPRDNDAFSKEMIQFQIRMFEELDKIIDKHDECRVCVFEALADVLIVNAGRLSHKTEVDGETDEEEIDNPFNQTPGNA